MSDTPSTPKIQVKDQGFQGVLELDDQVVITEGSVTTTMPVRDFLETDRYLKGISPSERLKRIAGTESFVLSRPLENYLSHFRQKPTETRKVTLTDDAPTGVLQSTDGVRVTEGGKEVYLSVEMYVTSSEFADHGTPLERLNRLAQESGGLAISEHLREQVRQQMAEFPEIVGIEEKGGPGILQPDDVAVIKVGGETTKVTAYDFVTSDKFKGLGSPRRRLELLAGLKGHALAESFRGIAEGAHPEAGRSSPAGPKGRGKRNNGAIRPGPKLPGVPQGRMPVGQGTDWGWIWTVIQGRRDRLD